MQKSKLARAKAASSNSKAKTPSSSSRKTAPSASRSTTPPERNSPPPRRSSAAAAARALGAAADDVGVGFLPRSSVAADCGPPILTSTVALRQAGFHETMYTDAADEAETLGAERRGGGLTTVATRLATAMAQGSDFNESDVAIEVASPEAALGALLDKANPFAVDTSDED